MEVQDVQAVSKYPSVRGFVSNGFWDNWELSFGGGLSMMSTSNLVFKDMPGSFGDRLGFEVNVAATSGSTLYSVPVCNWPAVVSVTSRS